MTGTGILKAFDFKGTELWMRDIQKDYGRFGLNWGYASSPLLHQDALYMQVLHGMRTDDPSYVLRIDRKTGKTVWRVERPTKARRSRRTPTRRRVLVQHGQDAEIVDHRRRRRDRARSRDRQGAVAADGLNPDERAYYRIVASPVVAGGLVIAPTRETPDARGQAGRHAAT